MKRLAITTAALILAACGASPGGVEVSDIYVAEPMKGRAMTAGYMRLDNTGEATRIVGASADVAERVELHTHLDEGGVMKMRQVEGVDVPAGGTVVFEPGALHLMMFGVEVPEGTTETNITLRYENGETVTLTAPIRPR